MIAVFIFVVPAIGLSKIVDRVIAVVNEDIITQSELEGAFEPYKRRVDASYRGADKDKILAEGLNTLLNRMIDNKLISQRAKKVGINVRDEEITGAVKDLLSRRNISMEEFKKILEAEGSSIEAYQQDLKDQMTRMRLLRRELKAKIVVNDDEIRDEYIKRRQEYEGKESVRIKQIFIPLPRDAAASTTLKLKEEVQKLHKRLVEGESFDLLASQFSQGPATATGGDVGFLEKGTMLPQVDSVAFKLAKDEISEVIVSPAGFHIIKVLDKRGAGVKPIEMIREEIKAKIEEEKMEKGYESWIADLRKRSHVEIKLR